MLSPARHDIHCHHSHTIRSLFLKYAPLPHQINMFMTLSMDFNTPPTPNAHFHILDPPLDPSSDTSLKTSLDPALDAPLPHQMTNFIRISVEFNTLPTPNAHFRILDPPLDPSLDPSLETHIHTHTHSYVHIHAYTHTHTHILTYTHTHIYTYTHAHIHTYTHTHIHI